MNDIQIFQNDEFGTIRTVEIEGEPWFVGKDVAEILGYKDTSDAIKKHVDNEDKLTRRFADSGQNRDMYIINESGLYSLIMSSKLSTAKKFKRWVTSEVLPAIRKHGAYMTPKTIEEVLLNPDTIIQLATNWKEEQEKRKVLEIETAQQKQIIGELKPKADYTDYILKNKSLMAITQIAKDYGMSGQAMNELLHSLGVQYKMSDQWLLYAKYHDKGYTHSEPIPIDHKDGTTAIKMQTKWTQKGRLFIYNLLKAEGIIPMIERNMKGA